MGQTIKIKDHYEYHQDDGQITAWLSHDEPIWELSHRGSSQYKRIFYYLIGVGIVYLGLVFGFIR